MVCGDGSVKLLDFGIAKARGANSRTRTGTVKGKNAYMSPEQILGKPLDRRSDVFALAIVMYEMLAIKRLFHRDSDFLTFKAITEEPIPDIRERRPDIPPGMRAALIQAMARDPNGRFDTALAFANAIRNSVATLGGPASQNDLARLLFTDFGDEMAARDEILKAADEPAPIAPPVRQSAPIARPTPPPLPPMLPRSGELAQDTPAVARPRHGTGPIEAVPSMMVHAGSQSIELPPPLPAGVIDLTSNVPVDSWMANPDTDLLRSHRWRGLRNAAIIVGALGAAAFGAFWFMLTGNSGGSDDDVVTTHAVDAGVKQTEPRDAEVGPGGLTKDDIVAVSRFGYFTVEANQKTTIFIDGKNIGETPMSKLPLTPGPHKVKAVGPRNKVKMYDITIYGGQPLILEPIAW